MALIDKIYQKIYISQKCIPTMDSRLKKLFGVETLNAKKEKEWDSIIAEVQSAENTENKDSGERYFLDILKYLVPPFGKRRRYVLLHFKKYQKRTP